MSLESSVHKIREFAKTFEALTDIGDALEGALSAEKRAASADKRANEAVMEFGKANAAKAAALADVAKAKLDADKILAEAKGDAAAIRAESKAKGDAAVAKAKEKADAIAEQTATATEMFKVQKQTNEEVLAMVGAQIAHAEAKLGEIRAAIANLTKA